jgi:hypothetical protein
MTIWTSLLFTHGHVVQAQLVTSLLGEKSDKDADRRRYSAGAAHGENIEPSLNPVNDPRHSDHANETSHESTNAPSSDETNAYGGRIPWLSFR